MTFYNLMINKKVIDVMPLRIDWF